MNVNTPAHLPSQDREKDTPSTSEPYETPRLIQTGSLRNVLGKSRGGSEKVNRFQVAGHKT